MVKKEKTILHKTVNVNKNEKQDLTKLKIIYKNQNELMPNPRNSRTHSEKQIHKIAKSISKLGFNNPVLIDATGMIVAGHGRCEAAKLLGLENIPTICLENLTKDQIRAYITTDNKIAEEAGWDKEILKIELEYLMSLDLDFDATITGFEIPEIDAITNFDVINDFKKDAQDLVDKLPNESEIEKRVKIGDLWQLANHKLYCGNALEEESYKILMQDELAGVIFTDPPYNVKIKGNVSTKKNATEFAMASGEMSQKEFAKFLRTAMILQAKYSRDGSVHAQCMDWRHMHEMLVAAKPVYSSLLNLCVWDKKTAGMGSLYRSQQELIFIFKKGSAPHYNNVELGANGRYRSNIWKYSGMHASNPQAKGLLKLHPTIKPTSLISDFLLDVSKPNDTVLDSFGGSGSTLLAAERTKRRARLIELETKYCDVILHRWEKMTGKKAELFGNYKEIK